MAYTEPFTYTNGLALEVANVIWVDVDAIADQTINTNRLEGSGSPGGYYYNNTFASKHYAQAVYISGQYNGPAIRVAASSNYYYCFAGTGNTFPGEDIAGSLTDWNAGEAALAANDVYGLFVDSATEGTVYYKVNGSTVRTFTGKTALTGGRGGVACYGGGIIDTWEGGDVSAGGRTTKNTDAMPLGVFAGVSRRVGIPPLHALHASRKFFVPPNYGKIIVPGREAIHELNALR